MLIRSASIVPFLDIIEFPPTVVFWPASVEPVELLIVFWSIV